MVFQEVEIKGDTITLKKKELERAAEHYFEMADKFKPKPGADRDDYRRWFYLGKADSLIDILKMFKPIDFV